MIFLTKSGSKYEIDIQNRQIRRVSGPNPPRSGQKPDGEWQNYDYLQPEIPTVGMQLWLKWDHMNVSPGTLEIDSGIKTSRIVEILT